jgi:hypothetical protein
MARETRSKEVRIAELDTKIAKYKELIVGLEAKKEAILNPPLRAKRLTAKTVIDAAKESGMSPEEIAKKLGIKFD